MAERIIVKYGVYEFSHDERIAYRLRVMSQVLTHPGNEYLNEKYQKPQGFYGYAQLMSGEFVLKTVQIQYANQCLFEFVASDNLSTFLLSAHTYGVLQSIANLANTLGAFTDVNPLDPPLYLLAADRVVIKLFNNTTLVVFTDIVPLPTLEITPSLPVDSESGNPIEPSSATPEANPLDPGYDIPTEPYDPETDDEGETYDPPRPTPVLTGNYHCTVTWASPYYGAGWQGTSENNLVNPDAAPTVTRTATGVQLFWGYNNGQIWSIFGLSTENQNMINNTVIISFTATPI